MRHAFGYAVALNAVMRLVFVVNTVPTLLEVCVYMVLTLPVAGAPMRRIYRRLIRWQSLHFTLLYTLIVVGLNVLCRVFNWVYAAFADEPFPVFRRGGTMPLFIDGQTLAGICLLGSGLAWAWCRCQLGVVVAQDGTMCPGCGYSLIGCTNQLCPECGREFTFQELGTTRDRFGSEQGKVTSECPGPAASKAGTSPWSTTNSAG